MEGSEDNLERLLYCQATRKNAERVYKDDPFDAENLTKWGGALLELASFAEPREAVVLIADAESKLKEALEIDARRHDTLWWLGNAYTSYAFRIRDSGTAQECLSNATKCYEKALNEDPMNASYMKSLEFSLKAPQIHAEAAAGDNVQAAEGDKVSEKKKSLAIYDALGWVILAVGIIACVKAAKSQLFSPPSR